MNILIYGATETGYMVASQLYRKHNITIVDDLDRLPERFNTLDVGFVAGNGRIGPMASFGELTDLTKIIFIVDMVVGRLELIPFLAMLHPDFWTFRR